LRKDLITAIRPGDNHSYMIGMFDGLEMIMGCEKEFTFRICDNCLQEYLNEQELEIIKKNIAWKDSNNWINTLEINSQFSYDIQFDDESGEHIEGGVYMGDGCCPVGDETVLEFLNLKKGDICRVDYTYENAIIGVDTESRTQWAWAITEIIKLSDEEINLYFIMEGEEEDYSDW
jgi:hypothetical protein